MTAEQLEKGIALKKQIDELIDFSGRFSKKGFDAQVWVPDNLEEMHKAAIEAFSFEYVTQLNNELSRLNKEFEKL